MFGTVRACLIDSLLRNPGCRAAQATQSESLCVVKEKKEREEGSHHMEYKPHPKTVRAEEKKNCEFRKETAGGRRLNLIKNTSSDMFSPFK